MKRVWMWMLAGLVLFAGCGESSGKNQNPAVCGDGILQTGEVCDGNDLAGQSCTNLEFYGGNLACRADCSGFDTSGCTGMCGDGVRQAQHEECEGADLSGKNCMDLGFYGGELMCAPDCSFDVSNCVGACGDGTVQVEHESCDGNDLAGQTRVDMGFYGGTLACRTDCSGFATPGCAGMCSDGIVQL